MKVHVDWVADGFYSLRGFIPKNPCEVISVAPDSRLLTVKVQGVNIPWDVYDYHCKIVGPIEQLLLRD